MSLKCGMKFCWECGLPFGPRALVAQVEVHGYTRVLHKACAQSESVYNEQHQLTVNTRQTKKEIEEDDHPTC